MTLPSAAATRPPRFYLLALAGISLLLALFATYGVVDRDNILDAGAEGSRQIAEQTVWAAEGTLDSARQLLAAIHLLTRITRDVPAHDLAVREQLERLKSLNPYVMDLLVINHEGTITQWTGPGTPPSVTDRDYYAAHISNPTLGLYVGPPLASKVHFGKTFFALSDARLDETGQVAQVFVVIVDVAILQQRLDANPLIPASSQALMTENGAIYARMPAPKTFVGRAVPAPGLYSQVRVPGSTVTQRLVSPLDGIERIVTVRRLTQYPIIAAGTVPIDALLAPWRQRMVGLAALWLLLSGGILWVAHRVRKVYDLQTRLATYDGLTGIFNRSTILEHASQLKRSEQHAGTLSILMIDVDHFKHINDTHGHAAGDAVLRRLSALLREQIRAVDFVGRYGGEEFLILMPDTGLPGALTAAGKLRTAVEAAITDPEPVTISVGVATTTAEAPTLELTLARADRALYNAKAAGRNCVRAAT